MTNQKSNNWLEPFRTNVNFSSRYALAKELNKDERTILKVDRNNFEESFFNIAIHGDWIPVSMPE